MSQGKKKPVNQVNGAIRSERVEGLDQRYEQLRTHILEGDTVQEGTPGLGVIVCRGMRAWMEACINCSDTGNARASKKPAYNQRLPFSVKAELVELFAHIVLSRRSS